MTTNSNDNIINSISLYTGGTVTGTISKNLTFSASSATSDGTIDLMYYARDNISTYQTMTSIPSDNLTYLNSGLKPRTMRDMFAGCYKLTTVPKFTNLDTSECTDMNGMFFADAKLTSIDLSNFDTSNVTDMGDMFYQCRELKSLDITKLDTSKVTNMKRMFAKWNYTATDSTTGQITYPNKVSLNFANFSTSNVTDMSYMFADTYYMTNFSNMNFDTSKVTNMANMFGSMGGADNLIAWWEEYINMAAPGIGGVQYPWIYAVYAKRVMPHLLPNNIATTLSKFDTSKVTNMSGMFAGASGIAPSTLTINLSNFDTSNVTDMSYMFTHAGLPVGRVPLVANLLIINGLQKFNTSKVKSMRGMFACTNRYSTDDVSGLANIENWDVSNVEDMCLMFHNCYLVNPSNSILTNLDLSNWNMKSLKHWSFSLPYHFNQKSAALPVVLPDNFYSVIVPQLEEIIYPVRPYIYSSSDVTTHLNKLDLHNCTTISGIDVVNSGMTSFDCTLMNLPSLTCTDRMFINQTTLTDIDISNINMSKVTDSQGMFYGCTALKTIKGIIDLTNNQNPYDMFKNCTNLSGVKIRLGGEVTTEALLKSYTGIKAGAYTIVD